MLLLLKDYTQQIFCIYNNKRPITFILLKFIPFISQNFSKKYSFIRFILYRFLSVSLPIEFQELCQIPLRRQNWKSSVSVSQEPSLLLFYTAYHAVYGFQCRYIFYNRIRCQLRLQLLPDQLLYVQNKSRFRKRRSFLYLPSDQLFHAVYHTESLYRHRSPRKSSPDPGMGNHFPRQFLAHALDTSLGSLPFASAQTTGRKKHRNIINIREENLQNTYLNPDFPVYSTFLSPPFSSQTKASSGTASIERKIEFHGTLITM